VAQANLGSALMRVKRGGKETRLGRWNCPKKGPKPDSRPMTDIERTREFAAAGRRANQHFPESCPARARVRGQ